jgi:hypothetical protein
MPAQAVQVTPILSEEDQKAGLILVELGPKLRNLYGNTERHGIFWEADYRHPGNGEACVVDGRVSKVYPTPGVRLAEAKGNLVQVHDRPETPTTNVSDNVANLAQMDTRSQLTIAAQAAEIAQLKAQVATMAAPAAPSATTPATDTKPATPAKK